MSRPGTFALKKWVRSPAWMVAFIVGAGITLVALVANAWLGSLDPGNAWGITYGSAAAFFMLAAALYGVRRRLLAVRVGASQKWLLFHVYGGALFMLLVFAHTEFRLPSGGLNLWLWWLSLIVTVSGFIGIFLQRWIPRTLNSALETEVVYERIPELVKEISGRAEELAENCPPAVREHYLNQVRPNIQRPQRRLGYFFDITGGVRGRARDVAVLSRVLSRDDREKLDELERLYRTKLEMDAQYSLQTALRTWLFAHVPVSIALVVVVALHVYVVIKY